jgi:hypothetical protein
MRTSQTPASAVHSKCEEEQLHHRIRAEFAEMPGLKLTLPQASRLFNLEPIRCETVLGGLVREGELSIDGATFVRAGTGRKWH